MKKITLSFLSVAAMLLSGTVGAQDCAQQCMTQYDECFAHLEQSCLDARYMLPGHCESIRNILYRADCEKNGNDRCEERNFSESRSYYDPRLCKPMIRGVNLPKVCEEACATKRFP